jgi:succinate-semialdehyde dehydrogenase/glutarate-semialdehyde dehydrogenase
MQDKAYIHGQWIGADSGKTFAVTKPANGQVLAHVPDMGAIETERAVEAAKKAFPAWAAKTGKERAKIMRAWFDLIMRNADDLAALLTAEQGKPLKEAKGEIAYGASFIEWFGEEAKRVYGDIIPTFKADARIHVIKQPVGVVGAITPWNFPNAMITRKLGPALAAGCTVVLKPAEDTPLSALALADLGAQAGIPPGVFNIVTGSAENAAAIGTVLTTHPDVKKISFTGSTEVGKILFRQSASTVKKMSLELGGNAPFIVFETADLDKAADGAIICKFRNAGQTCVCANRIYVQDTVYDVFAAKLAERVRRLKIGAGDQADTDIGPLINAQGVEKVEAHVADALAKGATLVLGGTVDQAGPLFYQPTLLRDMTPAMIMKAEETFGPVAGLFRFKTEAEAVEQANATEFGLASYFYSQDRAQCVRVAESLEYGMVAINEPILSTEVAPFGGIKESGHGREGSKYGIEDYLEIKYILAGGL